MIYTPTYIRHPRNSGAALLFRWKGDRLQRWSGSYCTWRTITGCIKLIEEDAWASYEDTWAEPEDE